jgi:hypothetical protein
VKNLHRYEQRLGGLTEQGERHRRRNREQMDPLAGGHAGTARRISKAAEIFIKDLVARAAGFSSHHRRQGGFSLLGSRMRMTVEFWHDLETGFGGRERL